MNVKHRIKLAVAQNEIRLAPTYLTYLVRLNPTYNLYFYSDTSFVFFF